MAPSDTLELPPKDHERELVKNGLSVSRAPDGLAMVE